MPIRVLLVDDQQLVREGIKSLLNLSDAVAVCGEAKDGSEVVDAIVCAQPDVILMDISMPKINGIQAIEIMAQQQLQVPVIILTTFDDHRHILMGLQAGAKGYLLKDVSLERLIDAIEKVHAGQAFSQPALSSQLLNSIQRQAPNDQTNTHPESLTPKERQVLSLMANGCSNKEISMALHKSEGTIKNHVSNILAKLGVRDRTRAVLLAMEKGLL